MSSLNNFWVYDCLIGLGIRVSQRFLNRFLLRSPWVSPPAEQAYDSIFDIRSQETSQNPPMEKI